ncbi:hypothetical protein GCM10010116_30840 [Microbispora rosea subsp. aerata]|nr:hypothetical protein GCM10010116_30840 [Microbispora rosea subsp. aerata]GLJ85536.1 hypothetical protein GCM10017588_42690 [Microbispora rosea subsp. aerata]
MDGSWRRGRERKAGFALGWSWRRSRGYGVGLAFGRYARRCGTGFAVDGSRAKPWSDRTVCGLVRPDWSGSARIGTRERETAR